MKSVPSLLWLVFTPQRRQGRGCWPLMEAVYPAQHSGPQRLEFVSIRHRVPHEILPRPHHCRRHRRFLAFPLRRRPAVTPVPGNGEHFRVVVRGWQDLDIKHAPRGRPTHRPADVPYAPLTRPVPGPANQPVVHGLLHLDMRVAGVTWRRRRAFVALALGLRHAVRVR